MMAAMRHPNVVMYLGVCLDPPLVLTEYCARGSLNDVLKRGLHSPAFAAQLDWPKRLNMALDAAKGMNYLHRRGGAGWVSCRVLWEFWAEPPGGRQGLWGAGALRGRGCKHPIHIDTQQTHIHTHKPNSLGTQLGAARDSPRPKVAQPARRQALARQGTCVCVSASAGARERGGAATSCAGINQSTPHSLN